MDFLIIDLLCAGIGRIALFIRYRDKEKRKEVLELDFDGSYALAGKLTLSLTFVILFTVPLILGLVAVAFYVIMRVVFGYQFSAT